MNWDVWYGETKAHLVMKNPPSQPNLNALETIYMHYFSFLNYYRQYDGMAGILPIRLETIKIFMDEYNILNRKDFIRIINYIDSCYIKNKQEIMRQKEENRSK